MTPDLSDIPDLPEFQPRFPWWGGDLQTIRDGVMRALGRLSLDLAPHRSEPREFTLPDGDKLLGVLDLPAEPRGGRPLVLLIHGAPGSQDGAYMISMSRTMLERGYRVLRINLRGAGPSRMTCRLQYSAGSSGDVQLLLDLIPADLKRDGIVAAGYSLGGAILLKYLGEVGSATPLLAAASVSAPIDLRGTSWQIMRLRNALYHRYAVLKPMQKEATAAIAELSPAERTNIEKARTIREYDDGFIAGRNNQPDALAYYRHCSAIDYLAGIRIPTLCLAAMDDPWVPGSAYLGYRWGENRWLTPLLPWSGGHVGFHSVGSPQPWRDLAVAGFLEKALAERDRSGRRTVAQQGLESVA